MCYIVWRRCGVGRFGSVYEMVKMYDDYNDALDCAMNISDETKITTTKEY